MFRRAITREMILRAIAQLPLEPAVIDSALHSARVIGTTGDVVFVRQVTDHTAEVAE